MVSIIVPTYNGAATIASCLASLVASVDGIDAEILVVDSSTDDTALRVAREFPSVRLHRSEKRLSVGEARNAGVALSRGEIVAFVDQDCIVPRSWLRALLAHFDDPGVDGVGGSIRNADLRNVSGSVLYFLEFWYKFPSDAAPRAEPFFVLACNCAFRRPVVESVPFPAITMAEDVIFSAELRRRGYAILYAPALQVSHINKRGWRRVLTYLHGLGRASAWYHKSLGLKRGDLFLRRPIFIFLVPGYILSAILLRLVATRNLGYLAYYVLLLPACLLGDLVWAAGFFSEARHLKTGRPYRSLSAS